MNSRTAKVITAISTLLIFAVLITVFMLNRGTDSPQSDKPVSIDSTETVEATVPPIQLGDPNAPANPPSVPVPDKEIPVYKPAPKPEAEDYSGRTPDQETAKSLAVAFITQVNTYDKTSILTWDKQVSQYVTPEVMKTIISGDSPVVQSSYNSLFSEVNEYNTYSKVTGVTTNIIGKNSTRLLIEYHVTVEAIRMMDELTVGPIVETIRGVVAIEMYQGTLVITEVPS